MKSGTAVRYLAKLKPETECHLALRTGTEKKIGIDQWVDKALTFPFCIRVIRFVAFFKIICILYLVTLHNFGKYCDHHDYDFLIKFFVVSTFFNLSLVWDRFVSTFTKSKSLFYNFIFKNLSDHCSNWRSSKNRASPTS